MVCFAMTSLTVKVQAKLCEAFVFFSPFLYDYLCEDNTSRINLVHQYSSY